MLAAESRKYPFMNLQYPFEYPNMLFQESMTLIHLLI